MNGYKPSTPRAALGMTAVAMAAITLAALVVLPAKLEFVSVDPYTLAAAKAATKAESTVDVRIGASIIQIRAIEMGILTKETR